MSPGLRKNFDQLIAHFLRELEQVLFAQRLDIRGRTDPVEQARGALSLGGWADSEEFDFIIGVFGFIDCAAAGAAGSGVGSKSLTIALPALLRAMISIFCSALASRSWQIFTKFIPSSYRTIRSSSGSLPDSICSTIFSSRSIAPSKLSSVSRCFGLLLTGQTEN